MDNWTIKMSHFITVSNCLRFSTVAGSCSACTSKQNLQIFPALNVSRAPDEKNVNKTLQRLRFLTFQTDYLCS